MSLLVEILVGAIEKRLKELTLFPEVILELGAGEEISSSNSHTQVFGMQQRHFLWKYMGTF